MRSSFLLCGLLLVSCATSAGMPPEEGSAESLTASNVSQASEFSSSEPASAGESRSDSFEKLLDSSASSAVADSASSLEENDSDRPLEQLPSVLSIPHFSKMRLKGTDLTLESVLEQNAAYKRYAISYKSNGLLISGIMNIPEGEGPFPLLILNHGYIDRSVYVRGRGLKREQDFLARAGFAVLHTDYRGHAASDESPMVEQVYDGALEYAMDSANALNAVRAANLPKVDATRVGMLGHSLGGGVTLAVLTGRPEFVDAAVLYAPVHADVWENFSRWRKERSDSDRTIEVFGAREEHPEIWDALSPQTFLSSIQAPVLLFQGVKDKDVPKEWSDHLAQSLKDAGRDVTYVEYSNEGHEFATSWNDFMEKTAEFFKKHL